MPPFLQRGLASLIFVAALTAGSPSYAKLHAHHVSHARFSAAHRHARRARGGDPVAIALRFLGSHNPTGSGARPWCGDFVNMTERLAGRRGLAGGALASAWRSYGHASGPVRGAIAIMRGHVARVIARIGRSSVELISGNWSRKVSIHVASVREILAFRSP
jgi:hypothetical protein